MDDIFRSENVVARRFATTDTSRWVITFDNYGIGHGFDRKGFGQDFLWGEGISAIHVMGRREDWYQYAEMAEVCAVVRAATVGADRVMTYGSSMGGYAALRFADAMGATSALALSPQYSIDPMKAGHDRRWSQDAYRLTWRDDIDGPIRADFLPVIVYDPTSLDGWHGKRIAQDLGVHAILAPYTGHPVTTFLAEVGMLTQLVFETLEGSLDPIKVQQDLRQRRRQSGIYLGELAQSQPPYRFSTSLALARRATQIAPGNHHALLSLAKLLTRSANHAEALAIHQRLVDVSGRQIDYLIHYGDALIEAQEYRLALPIAREVQRSSLMVAHLQAWVADKLWRTGERDGAIDAIVRAVDLDPHNRRLHKLEAYYRRSGGRRLMSWSRWVSKLRRRMPGASRARFP